MKSMADTAVDIIHQNIHQRQSIGHLVEPAPLRHMVEKPCDCNDSKKF